MKKLLAVVLAAATVLSVGAVGFAANKTEFTSDLKVYNADDEQITATSSGAGYTGTDTVNPDKKVYVKLADVGALINASAIDKDMLNDKDIFKFSYKKGSDNSKMIKAIALVEKKLGGATTRTPAVEIKLNDDYSDDEFKISPTFTFTAKEDMYYDSSNTKWVIVKTDAQKTAFGLAGTKIHDGDKFEGTFSLWISNTENDADEQYDAGTGGVTLKPQKNEDNEIIWNDENRDIARLTFEGDSDVDNFYPKLSTKWDNATYAEMYAGQDAYTFRWIGTSAYTAISSTSRATLEIYDPYYDEDEDEYTVDPENVVIYQVDENGTPIDVTKNWTYEENDDGDMVYRTKTRTLGHYIFCEADVAGAQEEVPAETAPEKEIPNTGR